MSSASKDDDGVSSTELGMSLINVSGGVRTPLTTASPSTTNFQTSSLSPTTSTTKQHHHHQHQQPSSPDFPAPKPAKVQDENQTPSHPPSPQPSTQNPIPLPNPNPPAPKSSIPNRMGSVRGKNKSGSVKRLPSLHEIGMVYAEKGGVSPVGKSELRAPERPGYSANILTNHLESTTQPPKPYLHKLITSSSPPSLPQPTSLKNPTQQPKDLLPINSLSPYTSSPVEQGQGGSSPSTRLRLPLSALNRVGAGLNSHPTVSMGMGENKQEREDDKKEMIRDPKRKTIEVATRLPDTESTDLGGRLTGVTPGGMISSISTTLTEPTPVLITPAEGGVFGGDGGKGEAAGGVDLGGPGVVKGDLGGLSGLNGGDAFDGGRLGGDVMQESMVRQTRWGPASGSTRAVQSSVNDIGQGRAMINDKILPLQHRWTLYYDTGKPLTEQDKANSYSSTTLSMIPGLQHTPAKTKNHIEKEFEGRLLVLGEFDTVQDFGKTFGQTFDMKRNHPSKMGLGHNLHLFKDGIRPMYEDPANAQGGRWTLILQNFPGLLDRVWQNLVCALIGETIDPEDEICGAVISIRPKVERIQVWVRNKDNWDKVEQIGHGLLQGLDIAGPNVVASLEFAGNTGQLASPRPHLAIGKGVKYGPKLAQPRGPPGLPLSRASSFAGSAPDSRRNSPTQSGFLNPFAGPLGIAQQPSSPRPSSLRPSASISHDDQK